MADRSTTRSDRTDTDVEPEPAALHATGFSSMVSAIASAFGNPTRREIYLFAHDQSEGVTANMVADRFDLHANVARHHLDKLVGGGYLEVSSERAPQAGAGRPSKRYLVPADGSSDGTGPVLDFSLHHDDLLITLLGRALELLPAEQAEAMAEEVGEEYGRAMTTRMGGASEHSFRAALHAVADALTANGFAARADQQASGELRIVAEHCPFGGAAVAHPVICAVDRGLVKGMLASLYGTTSLETAASLQRGDDFCVTNVED